jgi:phosphoadenosine phosphosulfate reductase
MSSAVPTSGPAGLAQLAELNRLYEAASPETVLRAAAGAFAPGRLALVSAFGPASLVLIDLLAGIAPRVPVVFIDTLYHFPETLELVERARARYDLDLRVYRHVDTREQFEARYGPRLWERNVLLYQHLTKVEPFRRAAAGLHAWITGRRREQAPTRADLPVFEPGAKTRVNPLAGWTSREVWRFIHERQIPYNPLHDQGYGSIGDAPLTTPVAPGEPERAGRWRGLGVVECGIHLG